jgi:ribonuclease HII
MANRVPDFSYENGLWKIGKKLIGGIDEVGRGAFAGPLVAACVVFKNNQKIDVLINDSKKLTQNERERASIWVKENAYYWGIGEVSAKEIDKKELSKQPKKP